MRKSGKSRNVLSLTAVSAVVSAALFAVPATAVENETYKTIHDGWLSEYQVKASEERIRTDVVYDAVSANNDTYASIHDGWLSEYEPSEAVPMVEFSMFESAAHEGAARKDWLSPFGYRQ